MSEIPELERIVFFQGELLTAADLTTLDSNNRELRWLHNRSLHNWGIGFGLDVQGAAGATFVSVNPGYAIDRLGREIILSNPVRVPIPAVAGPATYYLVANYVDDAGQTTEEMRDSSGCGCASTCACSMSGAVRLSNNPAILWKTVAQLVFGIDVILGQVLIQNCTLNQAPSAAVRRYATCGSAFFFRANQVSAADIQWAVWQQGGINIGFTAAIDTSSAKFQTAPRYMAQIVGSRSGSGFIVVDFVSITDESPKGFTLQVALPALSANINPPAVTNAVAGPQILKQLGWSVSWMGVEG
jgi:hypothetical protein